MLDLLEASQPAWHIDAACRRPSDVSWFPELGQSAAPAKAVCGGCPARPECAAWALRQGPTLAGIWGGMSAAERAGARRAAA